MTLLCFLVIVSNAAYSKNKPMPAKRKASSSKDPSTANLGFEATLWLAAERRGEAETAERNRRNNFSSAA